MQPHQVENEFPPTQNFSIKTLIGPHCQVGVRGESGHQMNCHTVLHAAVRARLSKHAIIIAPNWCWTFLHNKHLKLLHLI